MKNRIGKFFAYALGEILLVVIGILIALGINNANQERKDRQLESEIIERVHKDFVQNKALLEEQMAKVAASDNACRALLVFMNRKVPSSQYGTVDSLIYTSIDYAPFNPARATLLEVIQTGKLSVIRSQELRDLIVAWTIALEDHDDTFKLFEKWTEEEILPFLIRNVALKNVDHFSEIGFAEGSQFDNGYEELFRSREYENILDNHLYHHSLIQSEYEGLASIVTDIIVETDSK